MPTAVCPNPVVLQAFDRGDLPDAVLVATADHVGACARCRAALADLSAATTADPLLRGLRDLAAPAGHLSRAFAPTLTWVDPRAAGAASTAVDAAVTRTLAGAPAAPAGPPAPAAFGHYLLGETLGKGGMGVVYKAVDTQLKRTVALKMIRAGHGVSEEAVARFIAEAEAVARLQHPNVVQIHELGEVNGQPYAALEYVPGGSLDRRIKTTLPDHRVAARLMIPVARAVQAAHDLNLVHRDLKPANILLYGPAGAPLDECVPKVTDFGLVKFLDDHASAQTHADAVLGTPSYMAPEQAAGKGAAVGKAADVYSLGATLYDLLSGRPPFKGTTVRDTLRQVIEQEPVPPRRLQPTVPRDLETVCLKCLEKDPARRYASAAAVAEDLQRFLTGEPIAARPVGRAEKVWRWAKRKPALAGSLAVSSAAGVALLAVAFWATYRVTDERGKTALAVAKADQETAQREAADTLRRANDYHAKLARAREKLIARETGWTWAVAADVREAAAIDTAARDPAALRSAYASALAGVDIREAGVLEPGFHAALTCYSPDGRWLALVEGCVGTSLLPLDVRLVDPETGETRRTLTFPVVLADTFGDLRPDKPRSVAVSPDARWLAVGTRGGRVHRWDLSEKDPARRTWRPLDGGKECEWLDFAPDGSALYVLSRGPKGAVTRWETAGWTKTASHPAVTAFAVNPLGGAVYAQGPERTMLELDPVTLDERARFARGLGSLVAVSPDGRTLAVGTDRTLTLWDAATRERVATLREPFRETAYANDANSLRFSPDGRYVAAADEFSRHVCLYDVITGEKVADWRGPEGTFRVAFDPQSRHLAVGGHAGVTLLEIGGGREFWAVAPRPTPVVAAGLSPDGRRLGAIHELGSGPRAIATASLWDLGARGAREPLMGDDQELGHFGANKGTVAIRDPGLELFAAGSGLKLADRRAPGSWWLDNVQIDGLHAAAFGPGDRLWLTAGKDVIARPIRDKAAAGATYTNPSAQLTGLAAMLGLSVRDKWAVVGGLDGALRVFSAAVPDGAAALPLVRSKDLEFRSGIDAVALAPDESVAVVGTRSGRGYVVSLPDLAVLASWPAHADEVSAAVFLGPGLFATGGKDAAVRFWKWDGKTVSELWTVRLRAEIKSLGASADGHRLCIAAAGERGVHIRELAALSRRFADAGLGIDAPASWGVPRLPAGVPPADDMDEATWPPTGLRAEYFAGDNFQALRVKRRDAVVDWNWGPDQPDPRVPPVFTARWTGFLRPPAAGTYKFRLTGENGLRLWLDGKLVVDAWDLAHASSVDRTADIDLTAEPHELKVEYLHTVKSVRYVTFTWSKEGAFGEQAVSADYLFHRKEAARAAPVPAVPKPPDEVRRFTAPGVESFTRVAASADGRRVAAVGADGTRFAWDAINGASLPESELADVSARPARTPSIPGRTVMADSPTAGVFEAEDFTEGWFHGRLRLIDPATGAERWRMWYENPVDCVAVSPDGRLAAVSAAAQRERGGRFDPRGVTAIRLYDLTTGREIHRFVGHTAAATDLHFTAGGATLLSAGRDGTVRAWRVPPP